MNTQEIDNIKYAILRYDKSYNGVDLPLPQKSGTDRQREAYALQLATKVWKENFRDALIPPNTIKTNERIFKIQTLDGVLILCNLSHIKELSNLSLIKKVWHLWNFKFERLDKRHLQSMVELH